MTKKSKLFAWDFHGTLEQGTEVGFCDILRKLAHQINHKTKIELEEVRALYGQSVLDYLRHFFPNLTNEELVKLRMKLRTTQNRKHILKFIKPAPYARQVLQKIIGSGHTNILVSTSYQKHIERFLKAVKMIEFFKAIFGVDRHILDENFDIAHEKAKVIKKYAKEHNFSNPQIIVIGDRPGEINAGLQIGAKTYQYISPNFPDVKTHAKYKITDLREILEEI